MVECVVRPLATVAVAIQVAVGAAVAQHRFEFGPVVGYYRPMGSFEPTTVTRVPFPAAPADKSGLALGMDLTRFRGHRVSGAPPDFGG